MTRFIPVSKFNEYHPWPTVGSLYLRIHEAEHGKADPDFLRCVRRVGTRVLIDEQEFIRWVRDQEAQRLTEIALPPSPWLRLASAPEQNVRTPGRSWKQRRLRARLGAVHAPPSHRSCRALRGSGAAPLRHPPRALARDREALRHDRRDRRPSPRPA